MKMRWMAGLLAAGLFGACAGDESPDKTGSVGDENMRLEIAALTVDNGYCDIDEIVWELQAVGQDDGLSMYDPGPAVLTSGDPNPLGATLVSACRANQAYDAMAEIVSVTCAVTGEDITDLVVQNQQNFQFYCEQGEDAFVNLEWSLVFEAGLGSVDFAFDVNEYTIGLKADVNPGLDFDPCWDGDAKDTPRVETAVTAFYTEKGDGTATSYQYHIECVDDAGNKIDLEGPAGTYIKDYVTTYKEEIDVDGKTFIVQTFTLPKSDCVFPPNATECKVLAVASQKKMDVAGGILTPREINRVSKLPYASVTWDFYLKDGEWTCDDNPIKQINEVHTSLAQDASSSSDTKAAIKLTTAVPRSVNTAAYLRPIALEDNSWGQVGPLKSDVDPVFDNWPTIGTPEVNATSVAGVINDIKAEYQAQNVNYVAARRSIVMAQGKIAEYEVQKAEITAAAAAVEALKVAADASLDLVITPLTDATDAGTVIFPTSPDLAGYNGPCKDYAYLANALIDAKSEADSLAFGNAVDTLINARDAVEEFKMDRVEAVKRAYDARPVTAYYRNDAVAQAMKALGGATVESRITDAKQAYVDELVSAVVTKAEAVKLQISYVAAKFADKKSDAIETTTDLDDACNALFVNESFATSYISDIKGNLAADYGDAANGFVKYIGARSDDVDGLIEAEEDAIGGGDSGFTKDMNAAESIMDGAVLDLKAIKEVVFPFYAYLAALELCDLDIEYSYDGQLSYHFRAGNDDTTPQCQVVGMGGAYPLTGACADEDATVYTFANGDALVSYRVVTITEGDQETYCCVNNPAATDECGSTANSCMFNAPDFTNLESFQLVHGLRQATSGVTQSKAMNEGR